MATLSPKSTFWIDFGYSYMDIYTQTEICFADTGSTVFTAPTARVHAARSTGVTLGTLSYYASRDNYAYVDAMWKPQKRVTAMAGYGGQHRSRQHHFSQSADAHRHAGFQLPQAVRERCRSIFTRA